MSYILDALRKSEQERQRGKVPDLNSYKEEPVAETRRSNVWPWITAAVLVVNLAIMAFIWTSSQEPQSPPLAQVPPTPISTMPAAQGHPQTPVAYAPVQQAAPPMTAPMHPGGSAPVVTTPSPTPYASMAAPSPAPTPHTEMVDTRPPIQSTPTRVSPQTPDYAIEQEEPLYPARSPNIAYMPQLEELPADERAGIPDMTFSSHMYSTMPRFRSIIINGKRLKEGEYFTEDLQVREITDKGVIMSKGSVLFAVDVLGRWAQ